MVHLALAVALLAVLAPATPAAAKATDAEATDARPTTAKKPYIDTQKRFAITLPAGWEVAPMPGDQGGATFRRQEGTALGLMGVQVLHLPEPVDLGAFDTRVRAAFDQELGFSIVPQSEGTTRLAGHVAKRRRFRIKVPGRPLYRLVSQVTMVVEQTGYALNCESLADNFSAFEADCAALMASFKPSQDLDWAPHRRLKAEPLAPAHIVGHWQGGEHALQITPGGSVSLDRVEGTWHIDQGLLVMQLDGAPISLEVEHGRKTLRLVGGPFGEAGQAFRRVP